MGFMNWMFGDDKVQASSDSTRADNTAFINSRNRDQITNARNREAPKLGNAQNIQGEQLDGLAQSQNRYGQMQLAQRIGNQLGQMEQVAAGQQQGAGELAAQRAAQQALASQQAMARMGRGGNAAMAARTAARNSGNIMGQASGQMQQAAMQDQSQARNALGAMYGQQGNLYSQTRGQDLQLAGQNAQFAQQANLANQQANNQFRLQQAENEMRMAGMNDAAIQAALQSMLQLDQLNMQGSQFGDQLAASQRNPGGAFGSLMNAGGQIGMAYATGGFGGGGGQG